MEKHFTATAYVFHEGRVLLHHHAKLGKYLPPGGHLEPNETPAEGARREVKEETGLDILFIEQENLRVDVYNAASFPRPFLCLLEHIPPFKDKPAHQHMDMIYIAKPAHPDTAQQPLGDFRWYSLPEIEAMEEDNFFPDTLQIIRLFLSPQLKITEKSAVQ